MNLYVVVEGKGEKKVYKKWIRFYNPSLRIVDSIDEVKDNHVFIISGGGYPQYFEMISNAIEDVQNLKIFNKLVVSVDSEEMTYDNKRNEIKSFIDQHGTNINYSIIIQHFCIETWALGNKFFVSRNPQNQSLANYLNKFNILLNDPEDLPPNVEEQLNRAQFAEKYLRLLAHEKNANLSYVKSNPHILLNSNYFKRVKRRLDDDGHIKSFADFITAFTS